MSVYRRAEEPTLEYPMYLRHESGRVWRISPGRPHLVGRLLRCDVVLDELQVEGVHASVVVAGVGLRVSACVIEAPSSHVAATFVDGVRVGADAETAALARRGAKLRLADVALLVEAGADAEAAYDAQLARRREMNRVILRRSVEGLLAEVPLADLLELLSVGKRSGVLVLRVDGGEGRIHLRGGDIVEVELDGAICEDPRSALARLFEWTDGTFDLDPRDPSVSPRLSLRVDDVVRELGRDAHGRGR